MDRMHVVREFIVENYLYGDDGRLTDNVSFLRNGIIDSTGVVELASFLQATFSLTIDDDEIVPENMDSLKNIEQFLLRKTGAAAAPQA